MPVQKNHAIVFCPENQRLGQEVTSDLSKAGYQLHQYQFSDNFEEGAFYRDIPETRGQVVVLLSDNFLRKTACLYRCLPVLKDLQEKNRLIAVLAPGIARDKDGTKREIQTQIGQVNQMLVYMKYWHTRYLDLREKLIHLSEPDGELEREVEVVKDISANISSILNFFNELPCIRLEEFLQNTYEYFFNRLNDPQGHDKLMRILKKEEEVKDNATLIEIITKSSKDLLAENTELESANKEPVVQPKTAEEDPSEMTERLIDELNAEEEEELMIVLDDGEDEEDYFSEEEEDALLDELFGEDESDEPLTQAKPKLRKRAPKPQDPPAPEEVMEVAVGLFNAGKTSQALGFLKGAVDAAPGNPTLRYYYAYALARYEKNLDAAVNELDDILEEHPRFIEALFLRGELAEHQKDYEKAIAAYHHVLDIDGDFPGAHYRLGILYLFHSEGKKDEALFHLEKTVQLDHNNADAHYCLGTLYAEHLNDPAQAISHFMVTKELKPQHRFAWYEIAVLYHKMGKGELAYRFYQRAIAVNPELRTPHNDRVFKLGISKKPSQQISHEGNATTGSKAVPSEEKAQDERQKPKTETTKSMTEGPKTVLITGATAGIGRATADLFAKNGFRVIITGRRLDRLEQQKERYQKEFNSHVHLLHFDVRDLDAVKEAIGNLPEEWRQVDILINNAGLSRGLAPIHEGKPEDWDTMIDTNIKGLLYMTRAIAPQMVARKSGHIINVASSAGKEVYPGGNVYCATKFAVDALTKSMRLDLFKHNVRVSQVSPGHVEETEFARVRFDWDVEKAAAVYENFQPLKASDVADAIYYIATRPPHVNIQDIFMFSTQQAGSNFIDRSGR
jgi:NADP-dependent 3-hydroxy acid dehydrogenase YdfG